MKVSDNDIDNVLKNNKNITGHGFGIYKGRELTKDDFDKEFSDEVAYLYQHKHEIQACINWLKTAQKRKTLNKDHSSYGMKHIVERKYRCYVSNGAFIVAAILSGFDIGRCRFDSANAHINISSKSDCFG